MADEGVYNPRQAIIELQKEIKSLNEQLHLSERKSVVYEKLHGLTENSLQFLRENDAGMA